jgi:hypothetical protein
VRWRGDPQTSDDQPAGQGDADLGALTEVRNQAPTNIHDIGSVRGGIQLGLGPETIELCGQTVGLCKEVCFDRDDVPLGTLDMGPMVVKLGLMLCVYFLDL